MALKPRPMAEAPAGVPILVLHANGDYDAVTLHLDATKRAPSNASFITIADLLRAAEIVEKITPEGFVYCGHEKPIRRENTTTVLVAFRKLPQPVRYEYVTDGKVREPLPDDYIYSVGEWRQYKLLQEQFSKSYDGPQLCYRRVEVKP